MKLVIFQMTIAALLPVVAAVVIYLLGKKTALGRLPYMAKQVICGVVFGGIAVLGTEFGIPMGGVVLNCRDAAVLTSGLMFGAPAGIIAGVIGGVERWIAVAWGVGSFTRVACSVSTLLAGVYAAALRKVMFEDKKPGVVISLAIGVVMEVFHMTMVFLTNMQSPNEAMDAVRLCTIPMVTANGLSVMLAALALSLLSREKSNREPSGVRISQTIQKWLLIAVVLAFLATSFFVFRLQDEMADAQKDSQLNQALSEIRADIQDASDVNLLTITHNVADRIDSESLETIASWYGLAEISIIDHSGIIVKSTEPSFVGYNMVSGEQSAEFLCLLSETEQYVQKYGAISYDSTISRKYAGVKTGDGFVQVGYNAENLQKDIASIVGDLTKNRHVGKTGYVLIFDAQRNVVSAPSVIDRDRIKDEMEDVALPDENVEFIANISGEPYYCMYGISEGYYIVAALPQEEAIQTRNIALYVNSFMEILVFAVLFGLIYMLIKRVVVNRIKDINSSLAKITDGDLGVVVDVRSNEEFASLSDDINMTVDTLKRYISEASARIDAELDFAKNIQASALPNVFPAFPKRKDFDIYASMDPAKEVGGDFYDFYFTAQDKLHFLIADVSGKGIPAAMFMMRAKTELKSLTEAEMPLSEVFTHGNAALCEGNDAGMFVTAWQGNIDLSTGLVQFANAGHNPPLVRHADGKFEYLRSRAGFVLAGMDGVRYKTQEVQLAPGDAIYLYTDGVTEATNAQSELYGEDRLLAAINSQEFGSMQELCTYVKADVDAFVGEAPQFDDITMVALKFIGTPPAPSIHFDQAKIEDIPAVTQFVEEQLEKLDCPMKVVVQMSVAIDEIFSNIVRYGYKNTAGPVTVTFITKDDPKRVYLRFADEGIPYNPLTKEDPDVTLSAEERRIGGLGIYMVKKTMDDMKYKYENEQNVLTVVKKIGD